MCLVDFRDLVERKIGGKEGRRKEGGREGRKTGRKDRSVYLMPFTKFGEFLSIISSHIF